MGGRRRRLAVSAGARRTTLRLDQAQRTGPSGARHQLDRHGCGLRLWDTPRRSSPAALAGVARAEGRNAFTKCGMIRDDKS